ncbi:MAG: hypothetical protein KJZ57_12705, partial [Anaerolineales bacterium]|nr:hypothetical protein [Anaerolineales bacterium]
GAMEYLQISPIFTLKIPIRFLQRRRSGFSVGIHTLCKRNLYPYTRYVPRGDYVCSDLIFILVHITEKLIWRDE